MKITNIGGATAIIEHKGKRMLFDPWMNEGIMHGSWFHWPTLKLTPADLGHLDYIYISHVHEDHCAPGTIKFLNRDAEIILMHNEPKVPNFVLRFLKYNHFDFKKVHLICPQCPQEIAPGLTVDMVTADPAHEMNYMIDSGLILKWDDQVLYNANDCAPYEAGVNYIKEKYKKIDLALLPYSGGSGYPGCYSNLSHEEKMKERQRIFDEGMNLFVDTVKKINPTTVMPFADQFVVGGSRSDINKYSPHPPSPGYVREYLAQAGLEQKLLLLNSGQTYDLDAKAKSPDEPYHLHSEEDREAYIQSIKSHLYDHQFFQMRDAVPLERLIKHARARMWEAQKRENAFTDTIFYLHVTNGDRIFRFDLRTPDVTELTGTKDLKLQEPYIKMSGSSTLFTLCLVNHISWNMADGAFFLDFERRPNRYDKMAYVLLNYFTV